MGRAPYKPHFEKLMCCSLQARWGQGVQLRTMRSGDWRWQSLLPGPEVRRRAPCGKIEDACDSYNDRLVTWHSSQQPQNAHSHVPEPCRFGFCTPSRRDDPPFLLIRHAPRCWLPAVQSCYPMGVCLLWQLCQFTFRPHGCVSVLPEAAVPGSL